METIQIPKKYSKLDLKNLGLIVSNISFEKNIKKLNLPKWAMQLYKVNGTVWPLAVWNARLVNICACSIFF